MWACCAGAAEQRRLDGKAGTTRLRAARYDGQPSRDEGELANRSGFGREGWRPGLESNQAGRPCMASASPLRHRAGRSNKVSALLQGVQRQRMRGAVNGELGGGDTRQRVPARTFNHFVIAGQPGPAAGRPGCKLVPAIPLKRAGPCHPNRDGRDIGVRKHAVLRSAMPGHDGLWDHRPSTRQRNVMRC